MAPIRYISFGLIASCLAPGAEVRGSLSLDYFFDCRSADRAFQFITVNIEFLTEVAGFTVHLGEIPQRRAAL
ncbi:hypothetical protein MnTg03_01614 [bacterium MnTg03]|nr:hypothetical protein MnTg03_01614 [bacterium MnTg03]